jgi:hypothetical protein
VKGDQIEDLASKLFEANDRCCRENGMPWSRRCWDNLGPDRNRWRYLAVEALSFLAPPPAVRTPGANHTNQPMSIG